MNQTKRDTLYWISSHRKRQILKPQPENTGELTTVIDPDSITRVASNHSNNRETTMYGRHGKPSRKILKFRKQQTKKSKPKQPVEKTMPFIMLTVSVIFAVGVSAILWFTPISDSDDMTVRPILTGIMVFFAILADIPSWVYSLAWRRDSRKQQHS